MLPAPTDETKIDQRWSAADTPALWLTFLGSYNHTAEATDDRAKMNQRTILVVAALMGALSVAIGAFGAHGLKLTLIANGKLDTFELAVRYQFYHAIALLVVGLLVEKFPRAGSAGLLFMVGIAIFSGSLYMLCFSGQTLWGAVTPLGGVVLIAAWLQLAWVIFRAPPR